MPKYIKKKCSRFLIFYFRELMSSGIAQSSTKDDYNPDEDYEVVKNMSVKG